MKILLLFAALAVCPLRPQSPPVKIFFFAGQSNMDGKGSRLLLSPVPAWAQTKAYGWRGAPEASSDSGVVYAHPTASNAAMLYNSSNSGLFVVDTWCAYEGSTPHLSYPKYEWDQTCSEEGSYGPELSFLAKYLADHPGQSIAAIKLSLGGSGIQDWLPGGSMEPLWKKMVQQASARLAAAGVMYEWTALIWMQGENGASNPYGASHPTQGEEYSDRLRKFLSNFRRATSPSLKVLIGRIGNQMLHDDVINGLVEGQSRWSSGQFRLATEYRRKQQEIVATDPGNILVDTDNLPRNLLDPPQFRYHFTGPGYLAMGERFYAAFSRSEHSTTGR